MSQETYEYQALLRADLWRLLAGSFACPAPEHLCDLAACATELAECLRSEEDLLAASVGALAAALHAADAAALEGEYHTLFTTQVLVSPYEGAYQRTERGAILGDVAAFYTAFSLQVTPESGPPDALCTELAFLAWLALKEAYALAHVMTEAVEVTRGATQQFLYDHLGRWAPAFLRQLLATTGHPVYVAAAQLLVDTLALAADALGITEFQYVQKTGGEPEAEVMVCPVAHACGG